MNVHRMALPNLEADFTAMEETTVTPKKKKEKDEVLLAEETADKAVKKPAEKKQLRLVLSKKHPVLLTLMIFQLVEVFHQRIKGRVPF